MEKAEFNRWLFEVMNTVTLVAKRRGRILGFLYATLVEETSAPYPSRGSLRRRVALLDSPVIPFLEKIGYIPGKQYLWMLWPDAALDGADCRVIAELVCECLLRKPLPLPRRTRRARDPHLSRLVPPGRFRQARPAPSFDSQGNGKPRIGRWRRSWRSWRSTGRRRTRSGCSWAPA